MLSVCQSDFCHVNMIEIINHLLITVHVLGLQKKRKKGGSQKMGEAFFHVSAQNKHIPVHTHEASFSTDDTLA